MTKTNNIYLIGPMGAGKTSVGKQLAKLTKLRFYDTDTEIMERTGVQLSWIFEVEKEAGFRKREQDMIAELTALKDIVLSTGGGSILKPENRQCLSANGFVIYLSVSLGKQLQRTSRQKVTRPLLEQPNPEQILIQLNKEREPLYVEIADFTYNTDDYTPIALAKKILKDTKVLNDIE